VRRTLIPFALAGVALALAVFFVPRPAAAFGDLGAFDPRALLTGGQTGAAHPTALGRWSYELIQRTSAPARLHPDSVHADDKTIVNEPFVYWSGADAVAPLTSAEVLGLRRFFALGGVMLADDARPVGDGDPTSFNTTARAQLARVLPNAAPISIGADNVLFKTFYLLRRPEGRIEGKKTLDAIVHGTSLQVIFSSHDIGGALAQGPTGVWEMAVSPGGDAQREKAIRLAVNVAMYVLCSNYKDDQVHAPFLMRRRASSPLP
jgi:hypothetical protein